MSGSDAPSLLLRAWEFITLMAIGRYLVFAFGTILVFKFFWRYGLARRKIQTREATSADRRRELLNSIRSLLILTFVGLSLILGEASGVMTFYHHVSRSDVPYLLLSTGAMFLAHDAYFYWTHRAMHHPKLFRFVHLTHHRSLTPTPFAAYSFSVTEAVVQGLFAPLWCFFVPMHQLGIFIFLTVVTFRSVVWHSGVEVLPRWLADSRWFGWICAITHHDLHHSSFRYNYGFYFTWWDKWMGTEHPEYRERLRMGAEHPSYRADGGRSRYDQAPDLPVGDRLPAGTAD